MQTQLSFSLVSSYTLLIAHKNFKSCELRPFYNWSWLTTLGYLYLVITILNLYPFEVRIILFRNFETPAQLGLQTRLLTLCRYVNPSWAKYDFPNKDSVNPNLCIYTRQHCTVYIFCRLYTLSRWAILKCNLPQRSRWAALLGCCAQSCRKRRVFNTPIMGLTNRHSISKVWAFITSYFCPVYQINRIRQRTPTHSHFPVCTIVFHESFGQTTSCTIF